MALVHSGRRGCGNDHSSANAVAWAANSLSNLNMELNSLLHVNRSTISNPNLYFHIITSMSSIVASRILIVINVYSLETFCRLLAQQWLNIMSGVGVAGMQFATAHTQFFG
jgi:hypothetical protein